MHTPQSRMVRESLEAVHKPDVHRRREYKPGEVEEIAVAAVVREALWALLAKRDVEELPIEALVDEAAMAAAKVIAHAQVVAVAKAITLPQGWRATLGGIVIALNGAQGAASGPSARLLDEALAALRSLLAEDRG